jgi:tRNA-splicing ligase RtcB
MMEKVIKRDNWKVPIKFWLPVHVDYHSIAPGINEIERGALEQAVDAACLPWAFKHVAIMPDVHQGYGIPIGAVVALDKAISPGAVGVDIGCGMTAVQTNLEAGNLSIETLKLIRADIREMIPMGRHWHDERLEFPAELLRSFAEAPFAGSLAVHDITRQLGTLGGGNHFIEIQRDQDGKVWLMIHSGSRNLGHKIAQHYMKLAAEMCKRWHTPVKKDLACFPQYTQEFNDYRLDMNVAVSFAEANRLAMMHILESIINKRVGGVTFSPTLQSTHNLARMENHFGENVVVHRKGATQARAGEFLIIPGSQGTHSYICAGKGNPESFESCSHGAGRVMSRSKARATLSLEGELERMGGVLHGIRSVSDLDEAPSSYKDIDQVIAYQADLVEVIHTLKPLMVMKG